MCLPTQLQHRETLKQGLKPPASARCSVAALETRDLCAHAAAGTKHMQPIDKAGTHVAHRAGHEWVQPTLDDGASLGAGLHVTANPAQSQLWQAATGMSARTARPAEAAAWSCSK